MMINLIRSATILSALFMAGNGIGLADMPLPFHLAASPSVEMPVSIHAHARKTAPLASVSVVYEINASGQASILKTTSSSNDVKRVAHQNGSVITTDAAVSGLPHAR